MAYSHNSEDDDCLSDPQNIDSRNPEIHNPEIPEASSSRPLFTELQSAQPYICLMTRREFVITAGIATAGWAVGVRFSSVQPVEAATLMEAAPVAVAENVTTLDLTINGVQHQLSLDPRVTLLDLLRENLALTGTKKGCDHGQCGACTVLANGRRINSCLSLAVVHQGEEITTIEGIAQGEQLHPLQNAFLEHDGFQCGYCTPGQICSAVALMKEADRGDASLLTADLPNTAKVELTAAEIRERMSGNICRCGAYPGIVKAIQTAQHQS
jgi:xanthine dehydrogenase YagT iron-sulfur-binding subunit